MQREIIDFDRLEIRPIKLNEDDISQLDCTEPDGSTHWESKITLRIKFDPITGERQAQFT
jgi:hypothetical protein